MENQRSPVYGRDYCKGWIGFTRYDGTFLSEGISYFTRGDRLTRKPVSHVFLVSGPETVIESHLKPGVSERPIKNYLDDKSCEVFFLKPKGLCPRIADELVIRARTQIGRKYDASLIAAHAFTGTFLGRVLNKVFGGIPETMAGKLADSDDEWICSEFVAWVFDEQEEYRDKGVLAESNSTITPQELFEDTVVFELPPLPPAVCQNIAATSRSIASIPRPAHRHGWPVEEMLSAALAAHKADANGGAVQGFVAQKALLILLDDRNDAYDILTYQAGLNYIENLSLLCVARDRVLINAINGSEET